ncbi:MAG: autotransporter domain-containing protein [Akkermansia sp.]|nr:autotransporter domain-containing protein [Akkermansia sp.]
MKLHLPKLLHAALLSACVLAATLTTGTTWAAEQTITIHLQTGKPTALQDQGGTPVAAGGNIAAAFTNFMGDGHVKYDPATYLATNNGVVTYADTEALTEETGDGVYAISRFYGRNGKGGETVFYLTDPDELTAGMAVDAITFTATRENAGFNVTLGLAVLDTATQEFVTWTDDTMGEQVCIVSPAMTANGTTETLTIQNIESWKDSYEILAIIRGTGGGSEENLISNISLTATTGGSGPTPPTPGGKVFHAYILTGQSNSLGAVKGSPAPAAMREKYKSTGLLWNGNMNKDGGLVVTSPSWQTVAPQLPAYNGNNCMGPEYGFSYMMQQKGWLMNEGDTLGVIKASLDGGGDEYWVKGGGHGNYALIVQSVKDAYNAAKAQGYDTVSIDGLMYLQGESNTHGGTTVQTNYTGFLTNLYTDLIMAGIPGSAILFNGNSVLGEPATWNQTDTSLGGESNAGDTHTQLENLAASRNDIGFVYTRDLDKITSGDTMGVHYNGEAQITIGARYAYAFAVQGGIDVGQVRGSNDQVALTDAAAWWNATAPSASTVLEWDISSVSTPSKAASAAGYGNYIGSGATLNAKGITINGAYKQCVTINGGTISLGSSGIETHEADLVVNSAMVANDTQTWSGEDGYSITVGSLNVASGKTLTLGGEGDVIITAASTFTGNLSVQSGDLWLQKNLSSGNFTMGSGSMLHVSGAGMIAAKDISLGAGAGIDLSNFVLTSHRDITLATASGSIDTAHLSDVKLKNFIAPAGYNATLKADGNKLNLAFTPVQALAKDDLGNVMYVGDSITDGVSGQASWRYAFFKILTDVGVTQNEEGYYQHTQSSGKITTAEYRGVTFQNNHSSKSSARSYEVAGTKNGGRFDSTNIKNWLGLSTTTTTGGTYSGPTFTGANAPDTYFMMLGTNDLLSDISGTLTDAQYAGVLKAVLGYQNGAFDGTSGTFDVIMSAMVQSNADAEIVILDMPTWYGYRTTGATHAEQSDFYRQMDFNMMLREWAASKSNADNITVVNVNTGLIALADAKVNTGIQSMFINDGLHPSNQGELIIAGNVAKGLGYGGRTMGRARRGAATFTDLNLTVPASGSSTKSWAEAGITVSGSYTVDIASLLVGDGGTPGQPSTWQTGNVFSLTLGNGSRTGTLNVSEAYIQWGSTILYSADMSQNADALRVSYITSADLPAGSTEGYYVWLGDMLIGEGLGSSSGTLNGVTVAHSTSSPVTAGAITAIAGAFAPTLDPGHYEKAADLYWGVDLGSGTWDTSTANWSTADGGSAVQAFTPGCAVHFTAAGLGGTITLAQDISVSTLNVTGNVAYTFTGGHTLSIASKLNVTGGATANINTAIGGAGLKAVIGSGSTVNLLRDTTVSALSNSGLLAADNATVSFANAVADGGVVQAKNVRLAAGSESGFSKLTVTDTLTNGSKVTVGNGSSINKFSGGALAIQGSAASVSVRQGRIDSLSIAAGQTLAGGAQGITLGATSGTSGNVDLTGSLVIDGAVNLANVSAGSLELSSSGTLHASGAVTASTITLDRLNPAEHYLYADSLGAATTNFALELAAVKALGLADGESVTLASVTQDCATLLVNGAARIFEEGEALSYRIVNDTTNHTIVLTAEIAMGDYVWEGGASDWGIGSNWNGGHVPTSTSWVQFVGDGSINLDRAAQGSLLTVYSASHTTIHGQNTIEFAKGMDIFANSSLTIGDGVQQTAAKAPQVTLSGMLGVAEGSSLTADTITMSATGVLDARGSVATKQLNGTGGTVSGTVGITGRGGRFSGTYDAATVDVNKGAEAALAARQGLTLSGAGEATLTYADDAHMDAIRATGLRVKLNNPAADAATSTLTLDKASSLTDGVLEFGLSAEDTAQTIGTPLAPTVLEAASLNLDGTTVVVHQVGAGTSPIAMAVNNAGRTRNLALARVGAQDTDTDKVELDGYLLEKYYANARVQEGRLLVDMRNDYYQDTVKPTTENGRAGAGMLDDAFVAFNPQVNAPQGDLAAILTALETGAVQGERADKLAAAVSGASAAALGAALSGDVERQLRAIRNRTTSMGTAEGLLSEGLPYVNAWINAEGDFRRLQDDNTLAGYKLNSWGGTVGFDVDCTPRLTLGLAATAMQGEFTATAADQADGDLNRMYVTAFARYNHCAWVHTFIGTLGLADAKLDRTVDYAAGSYSTRADSDGTAFGFMYEVGYTMALDEHATICFQPVFNVSYRHSSLGGYTEKGETDAALKMGDVDANLVSFGLGGRLQSLFGSTFYNRSTLFEGRALLRLDAGDRDTTADASIIGAGGGRTVRSADAGAFGVEIGAGFTIPVGQDAGAIFVDASADIRSGYSDVNGTVGYRINF